MKAKQFFNVCAGILMLAIAYGFGANSAQSQSPTNPPIVGIDFEVTSGSEGHIYAITETGDVYRKVTNIPGWSFLENVFGGTVQVDGTSITDVKKKFREEE